MIFERLSTSVGINNDSSSQRYEISRVISFNHANIDKNNVAPGYPSLGLQLKPASCIPPPRDMWF